MKTVKATKVLRTGELTGSALDWAVAKCEGVYYLAETEYDGIGNRYEPTNYLTDWAQGGPIIEREGISINSHLDGFEWFARDYWGMNEHAAEKPLKAAMRCYVASKMGDTIEVPEELTQ